MNKLYICVMSLVICFQVHGMETSIVKSNPESIVPNAQYYAHVDFGTNIMKVRKAVGQTIVPLNEYRGTRLENFGPNNDTIVFFNECDQIIQQQASAKITSEKYTKILATMMLKLDPKVKKPVAISAQLFECEDHGRAIKLFDSRNYELGCFTYNDHPTVEKLARDERISKYIDLSNLQAISVDYTEVDFCGPTDCTIL